MLLGVNEAKAAEILIADKIKNAIQSGDPNSIINFIDIYKGTFWVVWNTLRTSILPSTGHNEEYTIASTYVICRLSEKYSHNLSNDIKFLLDIWSSDSKRWELPTYDYAKALSPLTGYCKFPQQFCRSISRNISKEIYSTVNTLENKNRFHIAKTLFHIGNIHELLNKQLSTEKKITQETYQDYTPCDINKWIREVVNSDTKDIFPIPKNLIVAATSNYIQEQLLSGRQDLDSFTSIYLSTQEYKVWNDLTKETIDRFSNVVGCYFISSNIIDILLIIYLHRDANEKASIQELIISNNFIEWVESNAYEKTPSLLLLYTLTHTNDIPIETISRIKNLWENHAPDEEYTPLYRDLKSLGTLPY